MYKVKPGDLYLTNDGDMLQVLNINHELVRMSVYNKAVTVKWLYKDGSTGSQGPYNQELNIPLAAIIDWDCKYIGNNLGVAQVLYGSNLKRELKHEEPIDTLDADYRTALSKRQDD